MEYDLRLSDSFIKKSYTSSVNLSAVAIKPFDSINQAMAAILSAAVCFTIIFRRPIS
jgi:hypothetical protein